MAKPEFWFHSVVAVIYQQSRLAETFSVADFLICKVSYSKFYTIISSFI